MAVPGSLRDWREYVQSQAGRPDQLTAAQRDALSPGARAAYDESRLAWLGTDAVLATEDVVNVQRLWATLRAESLSAKSMAAKTLSISGSPTFGKTTTSMWIARNHERKERARNPVLVPDEFQPSVYIVTPPATTPKMLMTAFCNFLGLPYTRASTAQDPTERVVGVLRALRTSLVVVDEIHNVQSNRQIGAEAASTLKLFADRLDCAFILAGIDLDRSAVFAGPVGEQLASRSITYEMRGCSYGSARAREQWHVLLGNCADLLPLAESHDELLAGAAPWLFEVTGGSIGRLRSLLRRVALDAIISGRERFTKADMEAFAHHGGFRPNRAAPPEVPSLRREASA